MGGKGGSQTVGYKYYLGEHMVMTHGPIDKLLRIEVGEKIAWEGSQEATGQITIDAEDLFGGEGREGGISGDVDVEFGGPAQGQNDYLVSQLGPNVPAHRGVFGVVLRQCYVSMNPYLKAWAFRAQRIFTTGADGDAQWYSAKAAIPSQLFSATQQLKVTFVEGDEGYQPDAWVNSGKTREVFFKTALKKDDLIVVVSPSGRNTVLSFTIAGTTFETMPDQLAGVPWLKHHYARVGDTIPTSMLISCNPTYAHAVLYFVLRGVVKTGTPIRTGAQQLKVTGTGGVPNAGEITHDTLRDGDLVFGGIDDTVILPAEHPILDSYCTLDGYRGGFTSIGGVASAHFAFCFFREPDALTIDPPAVSMKTVPGESWFATHQSYIAGEEIIPGELDMNPAHIIRECLTDREWGMGYAASDIDDTSFTACADTLYDEGLGMSLVWDRSIELQDFIAEIVRHIDAALYVSRTTGKFVLKLIRDDFDEGSLLVFDESNIQKINNPNKPTFGELINSVTVEYWNRETGKDAVLTVTDTAMVQQQGSVINTKIAYPGFTSERNATVAAQRDLRAASSSFLSCTIYTDATAKDLNIGDPFKLSWAPWFVSELVMRVTGIAFGDGKSTQIRITCTQDVFATPLVPVITPSGSEWVDPSSVLPVPVENQMAAEAPYYELVRRVGQASIDSIIASNNDVGYVMAAADKVAGNINARIYTDSGAGYANAGAMDFCAFAKLNTAILADQTVVYYNSAKDLDDVVIGTFVQIGLGPLDIELCRVDAIDEVLSTVTLGRGCLDTVPRPHEANDPMFFWQNFDGNDTTEYVTGEVVGVKVISANGQGLLAVADATEMEVTLNQRAFRPYPPGQLKINGEYYPTDTLSGTLTITWADRDRVQQTGGTIYDHTFGDIGPEAGTTYRMIGYINGVVDVDIEPAVSGETWTPDSEKFGLIEVYSKRDGVYSLWAAFHNFIYSVGAGRVVEGSIADFRALESGDDVRMTED